MISEKEKIWKYTLVALIIGLGVLLFIQAKPFINGILGAFALYVLLRKPTFRLCDRIKPKFAVPIVIACVILFILIPLSLFVWFVIHNLQGVNWNPHSIIEPVKNMILAVEAKTGMDILSSSTLSFMASKLSLFGQYVIGGIGDFFVNLFVIVLLLYFLLAGGRDMESYVKSILPFSEHNKKDVMEKVNVMVRSNTIGIPLLAIIQGMIAWIGFMLFDVPNAFLAAFLTGIASVIPVVGTAIVWLPLSVYFVVIGEWVSGICMLAFGAIIISQCDNLIRFILQKKMANTHPLITLFGVIAGLPIFGFMGIIFGPLLVSLFLLFLDMFRNEYLIERNPAPLQDESGSGESAVQERD